MKRLVLEDISLVFNKFEQEIKKISTISLMLIVCATLIFGTNLFQEYLTSYSSVKELNPGETVDQVIALGKGQTMKINIRSDYQFRLTLISSHSFNQWQKTHDTYLALYDLKTNHLSFRIFASNYTVFILFWNNTLDMNATEINLIDTNISITGIDTDVFEICCLIFGSGLIAEILKRIRVVYSNSKQKKNMNKEIDLTLMKEPLNSKNTFYNQLISEFNNALTLAKREKEIFPLSIILSILLLSMLIVNPSRKIALINPTMKILSINLILEWNKMFQLFWIIWTGIFIMIGTVLWQSKYETYELRGFFSLPIRKDVYAIILILFLFTWFTIIFFLPFLLNVLFVFIRFRLIPEPYMIVLFISQIYCYTIIILLGSLTSSLILQKVSAYTNTAIFFSILIILITIIDLIAPNLILPLPGRFGILITSLIDSSTISFNELLPSILFTVSILGGISPIYVIKMNRIKIE